jgi:hypothetical protein
MMATVRHIIIVRTPLPDGPTIAAWTCEAIQMGFATRSVVRRLCFARWFFRDVQGLGPTRDVGGDWEAVE